MNKHIFSLTLLLSVPHAVMCGTVTPLDPLVNPIQQMFAIVTDRTPVDVLVGCSNLHERLKGLPSELRMLIVMHACHTRQLDSSRPELEVAQNVIGQLVYAAAYKKSLEYTTAEVAERLARSQRGNVEAMMKNNSGFTGSDVSQHFGHEQHKRIVNALRHPEYAKSVHATLPTLN
jgi:hypothetical protein